MKKSLIALAVAGSFAAPAFAATSNVDIYGKLGMSLDYINAKNNIGDDVRLSSNSSRIGFKGSEDLGGGLAAVWQIENQLDMDGVSGSGVGTATGGGTFSSNLRNTFIGLKSNSLGTVLFGRHDTPYKISTGKLDIFVDTAADFNNVIGNANGTNAFDLRTNNTIAYISPSISGLTVTGAYIIGDENGGPQVGDSFDAYSLGAMYENGPLFAAAAYEVHNNFSSANPGDDRDAWKVGVGYKFGDAQIGALYESISIDTNNQAGDRDAWYVNGQYAMGNILLKGAFGYLEDGDSAADTSANTWTLGADYVLSKRTSVYAYYTAVNNDSNVSGGGTTNIGAGQGSSISNLVGGKDPEVVTIGMRHTF